MLNLLPPIVMVDVACSDISEGDTVSDLKICHSRENGLDLILISQHSRPSSSSRGESVRRPLTVDNTATNEEGLFKTETIDKRPCSVSSFINYGKQTGQSYDANANAQVETQQPNAGFQIKAPQLDCFFDEPSADDPEDYDAGQPQKLSFENELTFIPKLNSLSLRIAQSRSSVARRMKVGYENRVAALEEEMAQNFTFKPNISENSSKIANRLKTDFWTRQRLHTEKQRKMLETGPSTWHPKAKVDVVAKQNGNFTESVSQRKNFGLSLSDQIMQKNNVNTDILQMLESDSPYAKSFDNIVFKQVRSRVLRDSAPHKLESLKPRALRKLEQRSLRIEKSRTNADDIVETGNADIPEVTSHKRPKKLGFKVLSSCTTENVAVQDSKQSEIARSNHKRSKTTPSTRVTRISKPLTVDPDRFLRTRIAADQALRNKKVFICMGPYPVLRASLRRRGWIEKYYKADIACSTAAQKLFSENDKDSDDDAIDDDAQDGAAASEKEAIENSESAGRSGAPCASKSKTSASKLNGSIYGPLLEENDQMEDGFESDSQYGIMSRIVRNAVPTLIWTCKRTDIEFKFLTKDQIVNHFCHAISFTTKFGLCMNLRHLPWFDSVDPDSFFPRCHRLCSENERLDFIDDFRMLCAIGILDHTVKKHRGKTTAQELDNHHEMDEKSSEKSFRSKSKEKIISSKALLLALKACYGYVKSKEHLDIDGDAQGENYGLSEDFWKQLVDFYYQITSDKSFIINADSYLDESQKLLDRMNKIYPQAYINKKNIWIVKPGAKSRGRGIMVMDNLAEILKLVSQSVIKKENKWVVQKYIERPLLIYNTKFDIRQWFLVTDWNPLTLWFYKDCYLRFCSQEYTLDKLDPQYHLANNSIQKDYSNGPRSKSLPDENMWSQEQYREYLRNRGHGGIWDEVIYPSMKQAITYVLQACQDSLEYRKNSFELFGADFMLSDDMRPWLIEINSSPAMSASTSITEKLCCEVIEDTCKVVLDRRENKYCDTGKFELVFKQQHIPIPVYTGNNLTVEGEAYKKPAHYLSQPQHSPSKLGRPAKQKETKQASDSATVIQTLNTDEACDSWPTVPKSHDLSCDKLVRPISYSDALIKELSNMSMHTKKNAPWKGCLCGQGKKCQVVSAYHVSNPSLDLPRCHRSEATTTALKYAKREDEMCRKQALKISRMHKRTKRKIAYATLRYKRSSDGPGLSIGPGNGVKQI